MSSIGFSNPLSGSPAAQFLSLLNGSASSSATSAVSGVDTGSDSSSGVSSFSQLLNKLQNLSQSDPAKFKSLTAQIAAQLKTAAGNATGSNAQTLNSLSAEFTQASNDGNISALAPSRQTQGSGAAHHHHRHHSGAEAYQTNASTDTLSTSDSSSIQSVLQTVLNEVKQA